jgi:hypothetical protein
MIWLLSMAYLAYCDCVRRSDKAEKRSIVAAFTGGDTDNLMVGRNGVFYDHKGDDWDATITKIIDNPISIRQAFWAPYKRFVRMIEEQVAKRAKVADEARSTSMGAAATEVAHIDEEKAAPAPAPAAAAAPAAPAAPAAHTAMPAEKEKGIDVGTVAAIGVAAGAIGTLVSTAMGKLLGLGIWMPLGLAVPLIVISGPSMLVAWLKLRQRNIGPLLDANGWAVNAVARLNVPFGAALTGVPSLPQGASRSLKDPFAEKRRPWRLYIFLLLIVALAFEWYAGNVDQYIPKQLAMIKAERVLGITPQPTAAPETKTEPAPK